MAILMDRLFELIIEMKQVNSGDETISKIGELIEKMSKVAFEKTAYIRHRGDYWVVLSHKGKILGKYKTKNEAVKRLRQVEYFKNH